MIPGNRPEDEWWDKFTDKLVDIPPDLMEIPPEKVAETTIALLQLLAAYFALGFKAGQHEASITPFDDGGSHDS